MRELTLGFSPCPNDTFLFHALVHGLVDAGGIRWRERLEDVETLNRMAEGGALDVTKASFGAIPRLTDRYALLRSGAALGRGCGPLLVARERLSADDLAGARVLSPGHRTTAELLLRLWQPALPLTQAAPYERIMPAVARGEADAGLIIHESRFTYADHGLVEIVDLGAWWEKETRHPIPLGGILARRSLGPRTLQQIERSIRRSVEYAFRHPAASRDYVRRHAREMEPSVVRRHIELYVNEYTVDVGADGEAAVRDLLRRNDRPRAG